MDLFLKDATKHTPEIVFDLNSLSLVIKGFSIPEDILVFYAPLLEFIDTNNSRIRSNPNKLNITLNLEYYNSASLKFLLKLLGILLDIKDREHTDINYYYDIDDEDFLETGEDISKLVNKKINFIART